MQETNPYQPPETAVGEEAAPVPGARLYALGGIGLATFVGSPIAGGLLIAANYRALGQPGKAPATLVLFLLASVAVLALALVVPESVPNAAFIVPQLLVTLAVARWLQGDAIRAHQARGGQMHSNWRAFGWSVLVAVGMLAALVAVMFLLPESWLPAV